MLQAAVTTGMSAGAAFRDVLDLAQPVAWAVGLFFLRDVYREFKELRRDVHGPQGLSERLARIEGANGINGANHG